ncbi:MAG: N-acetyltransferase [Deltaproteobacteria bacterium]|nr:N-acetyltransferase [Deltaproteobacteria bacterium]
MIIRSEREPDRERIAEVTRAAFENHPISKNTEKFIVRALREAGALTLSLVAEVDGDVVGHVAFSPVTVSDGSRDWYDLGPISVLPAYQRRGIGKSLVLDGLSLLRSSGANGCALVGDPGYYGRFGFRNYPEFIHKGIPQEVFLALPFHGKVPRGTVSFHEGFLAEG